MRLIFTAMLLIAMAGCASMLVGGGASGGSTLGNDQRSSAQMATDSAISATIRSRYNADTALRAAGLTVRTENYNVTLSGTVGGFADRDRAVRIARSTDEVRAVNNQIAVNTRQ